MADELFLSFSGAALRRDVAAMRRMLQDGLDVNKPDEAGRYLLTDAAAYGCREAVSLLLAARANVNVTIRYDGSTALIAASESGYADIVRELISAGADVNLADRHTMTALRFAVIHRKGIDEYLKIVKMLIAAGAELNGGRHLTVLMQAARSGAPEFVRALVEAGADINASTPHGTALILAVRENRLENVKVLLELGADKSLRASAESGYMELAGKTALEFAKATGRTEMVRLLSAE